MATFSTTQTNQLFVSKSLETSITTSTLAGGIKPVYADGSLYFQYQTPSGVLRSDLINLNTISTAKATRYDKMQRGLKKQTVVLDSAVNSGAPVVGQLYELKIQFYEWGSLSPENQFTKVIGYTPITGDTASTVYFNLLVNAVENFKFMSTPVLNFSATDGTHIFTYVDKVWYEDGTATTASAVVGLTSLIIEEVEQPWILGRKQSYPLNYKITAPSITYSGTDTYWATITTVTSTTTIGNGKNTADREYFYMGERGDIYRNMGYPYVLNTTYLVDASLEYNYVDIKYYATENNAEGIQRSEKVITLVIPAVGSTIAAKVDLANTIIAAINTATGTTTVATLATT